MGKKEDEKSVNGLLYALGVAPIFTLIPEITNAYRGLYGC